MAKSGAAAALVEACKSPNEDLREAAAVALWDLAYDSTLGREAIARAGGQRDCSVWLVVTLFQRPAAQQAAHAGMLPWLDRLMVLSRQAPCSPSPATCPCPPAAGAVPWLAQLLLFGGPGAKEAAAACLAELAAVGPAVQQQIRDAGAVQLLQSLQTSGGEQVACCFWHVQACIGSVVYRTGFAAGAFGCAEPSHLASG